MTLLARHLERLRGKVAWITGGKRIGRIVASTLAEQGVHLVLSYRTSRNEAEHTAADARALGVQALVLRCDAGVREDVAAAVEAVRREYGRLDILVNMASVFRQVPAEEITGRDWDENVGAHVFGTFWPVQLAAPIMPSGSHIINVADVTSIGRPQRRLIPYVATKAAVAGMTRAMALDYGERGIFVNAIAPGPIVPPDDFPPEVWRRMRDRYPVRYEMSDREAIEQFALLVLYLALTTMTSGHIYPLDQGQNL